VDANATAMAESSRRAARSVAKGGLGNALFVVASAEHPPAELIGRADELTVAFPWGSLQRGALALDEVAARGIASLVRPDGRITTLVSVTVGDGPEIAPLDASAEAGLAERWSRHGLCLASFCPASGVEVAATKSTWARRLAAGRDRPVWRIELVAATLFERPLRTQFDLPVRIPGRCQASSDDPPPVS
jgi:16S rRNA (adenine(1408)-N(1))-methyltransferase